MIGRPPLERGPLKDVSVDIETMVKEYLELLDWDPATMVPSQNKLQSLGLNEVASDLRK
jgi:aldehyde:ferredoxin oxidoreductase